MSETEARLQDPLALDEIELYGEMVIAASASEHALTREEIDRALGISGIQGPSRRGFGRS